MRKTICITLAALVTATLVQVAAVGASGAATPPPSTITCKRLVDLDGQWPDGYGFGFDFYGCNGGKEFHTSTWWINDPPTGSSGTAAR